MIDTHMHVDTRPYEDFERLFSEKERVEKNSIRLHVCPGIHPGAMPCDPEACIRLLDSYLKGLKERTVAAIGETGLETGDPKEVELFRRQIELSVSYGLPIIAHTPRSGKEHMTRDWIKALMQGLPSSRGS